MRSAALAMLLFASTSCAVHRPLPPVELTASSIPRSPDEAMKVLDLRISEEERAEYADSTTSQLVMRHFGFGTWMRNEWRLWAREGELYRWFKRRGVNHPEIISGILIAAYFSHVNGFPPDFERMIANEGREFTTNRRLLSGVQKIENKRAKPIDLEWRTEGAPVVRLPPVSGGDANVSASTPYRHGVILSSFIVNRDFGITTRHQYFDTTLDRLVDVVAPELEEVESIAAGGATVWASGRRGWKRSVVRIREAIDVLDAPGPGRLALAGPTDDAVWVLTPHAMYRRDGDRWPMIRRLNGLGDLTHGQTTHDRVIAQCGIRKLRPHASAISMSRSELPVEFVDGVGSLAIDGDDRMVFVARSSRELTLAREGNRFEILSHAGEARDGAGVRAFAAHAVESTADGVLIGAQDGLYRLSGNRVQALVRFEGAGEPNFVVSLGPEDWLVQFVGIGLTRIRCERASCTAVVIEEDPGVSITLMPSPSP